MSHIILFGFKSSGKTHLGKRVAQLLNRRFIDTDDCMLKPYISQGLSIGSLYQTLGEKAFRALEAETIHQLDLSVDAVIALGAGAVLAASHVAFLQRIGKLVYLKADWQTVRKRILKQGIPSFVDPADPIASLHKIYTERLSLYASIPAQVVDVDLVGEEGAIEAICRGY